MRIFKRFLTLFCISIIGLIGCKESTNDNGGGEIENDTQQQEIISDIKANLPEGVEVPSEKTKQEIVFKTIEEKELKMIIQKPIGDFEEKCPVLFLITGGGFVDGDRNSMMTFMSSEISSLRREGYMVCSIDYRLFADNVNMSQIVSDCMDGIRYLHVFQEELNIDVKQISVCGHSAGGYLTLGMAAFDQKYFYYDSPFKKVTYTLKSIAALSPVITFHEINGKRSYDDAIMKSLIAKENYKFDVENLCPYCLLNSKQCKTLLVHGNADTIVSYEASQEYVNKARTVGCDITFLTSDNGEHAYNAGDVNKPVSLTLVDVCAKVHSFLNGEELN